MKSKTKKLSIALAGIMSAVAIAGVVPAGTVGTLGSMATVAHAATQWGNEYISSYMKIDNDVNVSSASIARVGYSNRAVVVVNGNVTLQAGYQVDSGETPWPETYTTTIRVTHGSLMIINGDVNLNAFSSLTGYTINEHAGSKIIIAGNINNNGGSVDENIVVQTDLRNIEYVPASEDYYEHFISGGKYYTFNSSGFAETTEAAVSKSKPATATYANVGDYTGKDDVASAWSVTVTPGSDTIESLDVKVNGKGSNEGTWDGATITGGTVVFGVAVNLAADDVNSVTAVVNGSDVTTTLE